MYLNEQRPFSAMNAANRVNGVGAQAYTQADLGRYAPGQDIYLALQKEYGVSGADAVYRASLSGNPLDITDAIAQLKVGAARSDSTAGLFFHQLVTDPFGAPLSAANTGIGNVLGSALRGIFTNPWVLLVVIAVAVPYVWPQAKRIKNEFFS